MTNIIPVLPGGIIPPVVLQGFWPEVDRFYFDQVAIVATECPHCGMPAYTRRQHTAYCDDARNWATFCEDCHRVNDDYWDERWAEYWSLR